MFEFFLYASGIVVVFMVLFGLEWMLDKIECRACDRISLRAFKHSYCPSCKVEIESDWDSWMKVQSRFFLDYEFPSTQKSGGEKGNGSD